MTKTNRTPITDLYQHFTDTDVAAFLMDDDVTVRVGRFAEYSHAAANRLHIATRSAFALHMVRCVAG